MKLIDTFLFSEPHESDLLYLKLVLESPLVDLFIIQECSYTLQGDYKGFFAEKVLEEKRFEQFKNRIVISQLDNPIISGKTEGANFTRENTQRILCHKILQDVVKEDDFIFVSDTDEMFDFTDDIRVKRFFEIASKNRIPFWIGRMRYWYDYDNRCYLPNIRIPVIPGSFYKVRPDSISQVRHYNHDGSTYDAGEDPIAFEYSYVFKNVEDVWRKKCTYAHTGFTMDSIKTALHKNHWPRPAERGEKLGDNPYDFFEIVELNERNSPKYVRDNLQSIKTNIVNPDYKKARECHS